MAENFHLDGRYAWYYENFNDASPLMYLHLALLRAVPAVSNDLIWLRLPSLLAGLAAWHLSRSIVDRLTKRAGHSPNLDLHLILAAALSLGWIQMRPSATAAVTQGITSSSISSSVVVASNPSTSFAFPVEGIRF